MENNINSSTINILKNRRSVRAYTNEMVTQSQIDELLGVGLLSPSSMNQQPWHITVVTNREIIDEIEKDVIDFFIENGPPEVVERNKSRNNKIFYDAPVAFFISAKSPEVMMDIGIVAENISIAACALGLSSVILGMPRVAFAKDKKEYWEKKLLFPEGYIFGIALSVGYAAQEPAQRIANPSKASFIK